jgi:DNA-directed RNA polymerase subunit RPC12/RpoP
MTEEKSFKFNCSHCGQHLDAEHDMVGMEFDCPACGQSLTVPEVGNSSPNEVGDLFAEEHPSAPPSEETEPQPLSTPTITVIRKRERLIDRIKKRMKTVGIGVAVLLLFAGVGVIKECLDETETATVTKEKAKVAGGAKVKAVATSIECLLNYIDLPNNRRLQVLSKSLESCPKDFQDAVIKYLDSTRKTINDIMTTNEEDLVEEVKRELYRTIRPGSPVDVDPRLAGLKNLAVVEALTKVKRRRESRIESEKSRLKAEIENAVKHIIDVVEKYGIDPTKLQNALVGQFRQ